MPGGVFCVEGQWQRDLENRGSVLPTLELLERLGSIDFIHKDVATRDEFFFYLDRWLAPRYSRFRVGHFAMHGTATGLCLTDKCTVELDEIAEQLEGRFEGKQIYIASCSVMRTPDARIHDFLARTGAAFVCGYGRDVDWVESAAFETVLLGVLADGGRRDAAEQRMGSARWAPLASYLGFRIVYADGQTWRPAATGRIPTQTTAAVR